jgi:DNA-binding NarL/FixJ family response regulator
VNTESTTKLKQSDDVLPPMQVKVLRLIASGCTDKEISAHLGVSCNTVKVHTQMVMAKLGIHNRTRLVIYALKASLISLDEIEMPGRSREGQSHE